MSMTQMHLMKTAINSIYSSNVGTLVLRSIFLMAQPPLLSEEGNTLWPNS